jgi:RNA polymerase sigma-70 factor (ECF subfamily)
LVRTYGGRLLAVARRMVPRAEDAQDVLQEALLSAFRALNGFDGRSALATWLHRIVVNHALMRLRKVQRTHEESIEDLLPQFTEHGHHQSPQRSWPECPSNDAERAETRTFVRACIDRLPPTYRTVILLRDIEELSMEEIANALGITVNATKIRVHRGRQALRTLLEGRLQGVPR